MTSPRNATDGPGGRYYTWRSEKFHSVTKIIGGGIPKPALINWAKKFTAEYACDNLAQLNALLAPNGEGVVDRDGAVDWLKGAAFRDRDRKADLGTYVHNATEAYVLGKPFPAWPPLVKPRMLAFERFLARYEPTYEATEASVYNRTEKYAGTLDAILMIGRGPHAGRRFVGDTKTGGKSIYPEVALQLAAYRYAEFIGLPDGSEKEMTPVDGAVALHLPESGDFDLIQVDAGPDVFRAFLYVREVFRFTSETAKTVLLGTLPYDVVPVEVEELV